MDFELSDLSPRGCIIAIDVDGEKKQLRLKKFSLMTQIWIREEFGSADAWAKAIDPNSEANKKSDSALYIKAVCKTIHHLMEDKDVFRRWEDLAEACASPNEILNLSRALLETVGISQPSVDKTMEKAKKKMAQATKKGRAGT